MGSFYIGTPFLSQKVTELETALTAANAAITANAGDTATLQTWASDRVKYSYPNGGSEGDERALSLNSVYTSNSPFPVGVKFSCFTECFDEVDSEWVEVQKIIFSSAGGGGFGVQAFSRAGIGLVMTATGRVYLGLTAPDGGSWKDRSSTYYAPKKWRIRCVRED